MKEEFDFEREFEIEKLKRSLILLAEKQGTLKIEENDKEVRFRGRIEIKGEPIVIKL